MVSPSVFGTLSTACRRRTPQIGVDQQHALLVRAAERQRQVGRGQRLPFGGHGARNHDGARLALLLRVVQNGREAPELLDQQVVVLTAEDQLLGPVPRRPQPTPP